VTFHSGEKESRSVSRSRDNRRQNFVRKVLRNVPTRVLPCLWPISPSWLRWRLSRPALLMLLSVVPANDSILPLGPNGNLAPQHRSKWEDRTFC
jgi:hypothetical protein